MQITSLVDDSRRLSENEAQLQSRPQMPLRPWLDPPSPKITGKTWNANDIRWVGNSFYFLGDKNRVNGVKESSSFQLYTPHQIQKAFRQHSILFQGDSTIRRLYGTMHGILSFDVWTGSTSNDFPRGFPSQVPNPPFGIPASYFIRRGLDSRARDVDPQKLLSLLIHSPSPIDPRLLEHRTVVDVNKEFYTEPCARKFPSSYILHIPSFGRQSSDDIFNEKNVQDTNLGTSTFKSSQFEYKVCRLHPTGGWLPPMGASKNTLNAIGQGQPMHTPLIYDYINTNCIGHIHDFVAHELSYKSSITKQYSIYIVGPGVWETVKRTHCHHPSYDKLQSSHQLQWPDTMYHLLKETLDKLAMLAEQSPQLIIIWRTSGYYDGDSQSNVIKEMNRRAIDYIHDWNEKQRWLGKNGKSNFLCMDFGAAIEHRSHGKSRLRGDMQAHYSLGVRVLQGQMLTNLLYENGYVY